MTMATIRRIHPEKHSDIFEKVHKIFTTHVDAKPHHLVGMSLWALHTHIYGQYNKTPRLSMLSPVHNCGKSTVLDILGSMVWNAKRIIDPSVASTFRLAPEHTLLMDEVDNMSIIRNMRAILNDGHSFGGSVVRVGKDGTVISYPVFGPVAFAGIGRIPATLMSRSLVIRLHRSNKVMERFKTLEQYHANDLIEWSENVKLNPDPLMPNALVGRDADKWRPLIAVADSFNQGVLARDTAVAFINEGDTLDIKESVLRDTQKVFLRIKLNVISVDTLFAKLQEDKEGEFEIDYINQKVTKIAIGRMLVEFQIRSKVYRLNGGIPQRCWFKEDFEEMWQRYA
jgi:hypothetical protein